MGGFPHTNKGDSTDGKKGPSPDLQKLNISLLSGIDLKDKKMRIHSRKFGKFRKCRARNKNAFLPPSLSLFSGHTGGVAGRLSRE